MDTYSVLHDCKSWSDNSGLHAYEMGKVVSKLRYIVTTNSSFGIRSDYDVRIRLYSADPDYFFQRGVIFNNMMFMNNRLPMGNFPYVEHYHTIQGE